MAYTPLTWVDNVTDVNAFNLNHIEQGVDANDAAISVLDGEVNALQLNLVVPPVVNGSWIKGVGGVMVWSTITIADVTSLQTTLDAKIPLTQKAAASGVASLDATSRAVQQGTVDKIYSVGQVEGNVPIVRSGVTVWEAPAGGGGSADLVYEGTWSGATQYTDGDIVLYNGVLYMAVQTVTGTPPEDWGV